MVHLDLGASIFRLICFYTGLKPTVEVSGGWAYVIHPLTTSVDGDSQPHQSISHLHLALYAR